MSAKSRQTSTKRVKTEVSTASKHATAADDKAGTPIVFEEGLDGLHRDHMTRVAYYTDPQGYGKFRIRVSGRDKSIRDYAATARIVELQIMPIAQVDTAAATRQRRAAAKYWRGVWHERIARLQRVVKQVGVELLIDPERLWQQSRDIERAETNFQTQLNWDVDQVIQVEPVGELLAGEIYWFTMVIDPQLGPKGHHFYPMASDLAYSVSVSKGAVSIGDQRTYSEGATERGIAVQETAGNDAEYTITINGARYT